MDSVANFLSKPARAKPVYLDSRLSVRQAAIICFRAAIWQVNTNFEAIRHGGGVEHVHQLRTALRRLRTSRRIFSKAMNADNWVFMDQKIHELEQRMGEIRDLDVFIQKLRKMEMVRPEIKQISQMVTEVRKVKFVFALKYLATPKVRNLTLNIQKTITSESCYLAIDIPITEFASCVLEDQYGKVRKQIRKWNELDNQGRHLLRRRIKRLTIASELLNSLFPKNRTQKYLKILHKLQKYLGKYNDLVIFQAILLDLICKNPDSLPILNKLIAEFDASACLMLDVCASNLARLVNWPIFWSPQVRGGNES